MPESTAPGGSGLTPAPELILASASPYRRELLARIAPHFRTLSPDVNESPGPGETGAALALRLARSKAAAVAALHPQVLVIGSDQVADLDGQLLGKPGSHAAARAQLTAAAGRTLQFHTAVCVARGARTACRSIATTVRMRALDAASIERYLEREPALDCAGSFKAEGLGIALFESLGSDDPTALIGLPLIATCELLREFGFDPLLSA